MLTHRHMAMSHWKITFAWLEIWRKHLELTLKVPKITKTIGNVHDIGKRTVKFSRVLERMESKVNHAIVGAEYLHNECFLENEKRRYIEDRMMHLTYALRSRGIIREWGNRFRENMIWKRCTSFRKRMNLICRTEMER